MQELSKTNSLLSNNGTENSIAEIVRGHSPTFQALQNGGAETDLKKAIALETFKFIKVSYPTTDAELVSKEFAKELFERKDWKLADIKMFFKFIRENADKEDFKVLGNTIGLMTLLKFVTYYEEQRSWAREQKHQEFKEQEKIQPSEQISEWVQRILKTVSDHTPKIEYSTKPQKLFDPIIYESDYDTFLKLIPDLSAEEKKKFYDSVYNYESITDKEMERRKKLLQLLK